MREFILFSRKGQTDSNFVNLHDAGRLDVVHECIVASFFLSHGLRRNVVFNALLSGPSRPPLNMRLDGQTLYDVRTDQKTWEQILRKILSGGKHPGISLQKTSFEALLKEKASHATILVLEEGGKDIASSDLDKDSVFVLGDHVGLPKNVENFALRYGQKVSLGKQPYLAASCVTILNYMMDRKKTC
jgi:tRNA (pseudouridine54-N1)-methyltransferase